MTDLLELKRAAAGRWPEILSRLGGVDERVLDGKHHPCPRCHGKDRFRLLDQTVGAIFCNGCFSEKNGDGFAALQWALGCEFPEAKRMVEDYLGVVPPAANGHPLNGKHKVDPLEQVAWIEDDDQLDSAITVWCLAKRGLEPEAVKRYEPRLCRWPRSGSNAETCLAFLGRCSVLGDVRAVLLYRPNGSEFSASGPLGARKSHLVKGSQESWLWPGNVDDLAASKTIAKCEGLPDAIALASVMSSNWLPVTNACGARSTRKLDYAFAANRSAFIFADADVPGVEGAELHAAQFRDAGAYNVRVVVPPFEISPDHGKDLRDWLNEGHAADDVMTLANAAREAVHQDAPCLEHDPSEPPIDDDEESDWPEANPISTGSKSWEQRYQEGVSKHGTGLNSGQRIAVAREAEARRLPSRAPLRYRAFPVQVFPRAVRRFIKAAAKAVRVDAALVAQPTLAVLSTAIGNTVRFSPKGRWCEPAAVWPIVLAESGTGKSPAASIALNILHKIQSNNFRKHDAEMASYQQKLLEYKVAESAWTRSGAKKGEPPPEKPEEPACPRLVVSDTTMERFAGILNENPRGVMLWRDELSAFLKSFDQYKSGKGGDLGHWLSIWSAESILVDRKVVGKRPIHVRSAFASVHGGVQPDIWARLLKNGEFVEAGLVARFLAAMPPRRSQRWSDDDVDDHVLGAMVQVVENLLSIRMEFDEFEDPKPRILRLTPDAKRHFVAWHDQLVEEQEELAGNLAAFYSKLKGAAIRLAGIIQLARWACGEDGAGADRVVDLQAIEAGCALASWYAYEARRIDACLRETPEERDQRLLIEKLEFLGGRVAVRDLCRATNRLKGKVALAEHELKILERLRIGRFEVKPAGPKGGHPLREFVLFPQERGDTTSENDEGNEVEVVAPVVGGPESQGTVISQEGGVDWVDMTV